MKSMRVEQHIAFYPSQDSMVSKAARDKLQTSPKFLFTLSPSELCQEFDYLVETGAEGVIAQPSSPASRGGLTEFSSAAAAAAPLYRLHDPMKVPTWMHMASKPTERSLTKHLEDTVLQISDQLSSRQGSSRGGLVGITRDSPVPVHHMRAVLLRYWLDHTPLSSPEKRDGNDTLQSSSSFLSASAGNKSVAPSTSPSKKSPPSGIAQRPKQSTGRKSSGRSNGNTSMIPAPVKGSKAAASASKSKSSNTSHRIMVPPPSITKEEPPVDLLALLLTEDDGRAPHEGLSPRMRCAIEEVVEQHRVASLSSEDKKKTQSRVCLFHTAALLCQHSHLIAEMALSYLLEVVVQVAGVPLPPVLSDPTTAPPPPSLPLKVMEGWEAEEVWWRDTLLPILHLVPQTSWRLQSLERLATVLLAVTEAFLSNAHFHASKNGSSSINEEEERSVKQVEVTYTNKYEICSKGVKTEEPVSETRPSVDASFFFSALDGFRNIDIYREAMEHLNLDSNDLNLHDIEDDDEEAEDDFDDPRESFLDEMDVRLRHENRGHHSHRRKPGLPTAVGRLQLKMPNIRDITVTVTSIKEGVPMSVLLLPRPESMDLTAPVPLTKLLSTDAVGKPLRHSGGPCDVVVLLGATTKPMEEKKKVFQAEVVVTAVRPLNTEWTAELQQTLLVACLSAATGLRLEVERLKDAVAPFQDGLVGELVSSGSTESSFPHSAQNDEEMVQQERSRKGSAALREWMHTLTDVELRRSVLCRSAQIPAVRAVLTVLSHYLGQHFSEMEGKKAWQSYRWRDVLRRVSNVVSELPMSSTPAASSSPTGWSEAGSPRSVTAEPSVSSVSEEVECPSSRGAACSAGETIPTEKAPDPMAVAMYLIEHVNPLAAAGVSTPDLVKASISLFSHRSLTLCGITQILVQRQAYARNTALFLRLVQSAFQFSTMGGINCTEFDQPAYLAATTKLVCDFLSARSFRYRGAGTRATHPYLSSFKGFEAKTVTRLRASLHKVLEDLFSGLKDALVFSKSCIDAQQYVFHAWPYGPFALLTISLLSTVAVSSMEDGQISFSLAEISQSLLPTSPKTSHSATKDMDDEEVSGHTMIPSWLSSALHAIHTVALRREVEDYQPITLRGISHRNRPHYAGDPVHTACSSTPLFLPNDPNTRLPVSVDISMVQDWSKFAVGFTTVCPFRNHSDLQSRYTKWASEGAQYISNSALYYRESLSDRSECQKWVQLPQLSEGDTVSIRFSVHQLRWCVHWLVNEVEVAVLLTLECPLWLVLSYTEQLSGNGGAANRNAYQCHIRGAEESSFSSFSLLMLSENIFQPRAPVPVSKITPSIISLHRVHSFFTLTLDNTVRNASKSQKGLQRGSFSPLLQFSSSNAIDGGANENTLSGFLVSPIPLQCLELAHRCLLEDRTRVLAPRANCGSTVTSAASYAPPLLCMSPMAYLCNLVIADYAILLAMTFERTITMSKSIMDTLTAVLEERDCLMEEVQSVVLSVLHSAIRMRAGGFSFSNYDPSHLWKICLKLAQHTERSGSYRPMFSPQTVAPSMQAMADGIRVEVIKKGNNPHLAFAASGISLIAPAEVVTFSVRLLFPCDEGMLPHQVGVSLTPPSIQRVQGPVVSGSQSRLAGHDAGDDCLGLHNFLEPHNDRTGVAELTAHQRSWISTSRKIIFSSGDTITVQISTSHRSVSFYRNGEPLGTLYTIPPHISIVYPYVGLGGVSKAQWMFPSCELELQARCTMRAALQCWGTQLFPEVQHLLQAAAQGETAGLILLGSDGDERTAFYRMAEPTVESSVSSKRWPEMVRLHRFDGPHVMVERTEGSGDFVKAFPPQLVSAYATTVPNILPWNLIVSELLAVLPELLKDGGTEDESEVHLRHPRALLRVLRLWATASSGAVSGTAANLIPDLLRRLLKVLKFPIVGTKVSSEGLIQEAWARLVHCRDTPMEVFLSKDLVRSSVGTTTTTTLPDTSSPSTAFPHLKCLHCDKSWNVCQDATHEAPLTRCSALHTILLKHNAISSYTGVFGRWSKGKLFAEVKEAKTEPKENLKISGEGESVHGVFHFTGLRESPVSFTGSIWFDCHTVKESVDDEVAIFNMEWACDVCTFLNEPATIRCSMCEKIRSGAVWTCSMCQCSLNPVTLTMCSLCGTPRADRRRPRKPQGEPCYCTVCGALNTYSNFGSLKLWRYCSSCGAETRWLPAKPFRGSVKGRLIGDGDTLLLSYVVDGHVYCESPLPTSAYTAESLESQVKTAADKASNKGTFDLESYGPPLLSNAVRPVAAGENTEESFNASGSSAPVSELTIKRHNESDAVLSVLAYYANWLILQYGPTVMPSIFSEPDVVLHLRVFERSWLSSLAQLTREQASRMLAICFQRLRAHHLLAHEINNLMSISNEIMRLHKDLQPLRSQLLYELVRFSHSDSKHAALKCIVELVEIAHLDPINLRPLSTILLPQPQLKESRRAAIFCKVNHVECWGTQDVFIPATSLFIQSIRCMESSSSLPQLLDGNIPRCFPHSVALSETFLNEVGDLLSGQLRGNVGVVSSAGGKHYFEAVLPLGGIKGGMAVVGWGTLQHEQESSNRHVGSDMHSWGYNFNDSIYLMELQQITSVPRLPTGGDVIGIFMDLSTKMMGWSLNGVEIIKLSIPSHGEGEEMYPYLSGSVPRGISMRLTNTQYCPEGFKDFTPSPAVMRGIHEKSKTEPQSYELYKELAGFVEEACVSDFHVSSSTRSLLNSRRVLRLLPKYPLVMELVSRTNMAAGRSGKGTNKDKLTIVPIGASLINSGPGSTDLDEFCDASLSCCPGDEHCDETPSWDVTVLTPYIEHLSAMSDLTVIVARNFDFMRDSTVFNRHYMLARDLLLSRGRWSLFQISSGTSPIYVGTSDIKQVTMDLVAAKKALKGHMTDSTEENNSVLTPQQVVMTRSVTGQLFQQIETSPIYKRAVMFAVKLHGDVTTDAGGVTRSVMSAISDELNYRVVKGERTDPAVPLFKLCSHSTIFTIVPNVEQFRNETTGEEDTALFHRMLQWLGKLLGNLTLCGTVKLPLHFPRLLWKFLTFETCTIEDYYFDIDDSIRHTINNPELLQSSHLLEMLLPAASRLGVEDPTRECASSSASGGLRRADSRLELNSGFPTLTSVVSLASLDSFGDLNSTGMMDLVETLTPEQRKAKVEEALLHQYDHAMQSIRNGLLTVLPQSSLETIRWDDLRTRICGTASLRSDDVMAFMDCTSISSKLQGHLQEVLESMTDLERSQFLLFCSGQSCLPLPEKVHVSCGDDPHRMPTAHTCLPISLQLQPYDTVDDLREKLMHCLPHSRHFGFV